MLFMPFQVLGTWFRALLAVAILGGGIYLLDQWNSHRVVYVVDDVPAVGRADDDAEGSSQRLRRVEWRAGFNRETTYLAAGVALVAWSLGGGFFAGSWLFRKRSQDDPQQSPRGTVHRLARPDGTELHVECYGPADGVPLIVTHGWGLDSDEWYYLKRELGSRFRLITWDLPGLGQSSRPDTNDWSLEKLARDLEAVLALAEGRPAVLLGHSIGGMIILTLCRLFPESLGHRICGIVLAQTTYTNPVRTTSMAALYVPLQKPILEPLCHLMVWLSPLVWVLNWMSYLNGSAHRSTERTSFSGRESKGQLDYVTRYYVRAWPGVVGRGLLAMFRYDATHALRSIFVPTLIIAGDQDTICTPEASVEMANAIPNATLVTLNDARHCGLFEHHQQFATAVREFTTDCAESAPTIAAGRTVSGRARK